MPIHRVLRPLALVVLATVAVGACGDDDGTPVASGSDRDGRNDTPVLIIGHEGGFTTPEYVFAGVPNLVVYEDGRVVTLGAQILIYPGPALPPLFESQLSGAGYDSLVAAIRDAGLAESDVDYGTPNVADAGDTVVTVRIDGVEHVHRATALGFDDGSGLTDDQRAARAALEAFVAEVTDLAALAGPGQLSGEVVHEVERYRLWVRPAEEVGVAPDDEPAPTEVDWTVEGVELAESACLPVEGSAAAEVTALLAEADQLTRFVDADGTVWVVVARPVLPHEPTCPEA
jgi:hypothetical protein